MAKDYQNWEPDLRKAREKIISKDFRLQEDVERIARETRENAVSPLNLLDPGTGLPPFVSGH